MSDAIVNRIASEVRERQLGEESGHDWTPLHEFGISRFSSRILKVVTNMLSLAALLHDVGDWKLFDGDEASGEEEVRGIMQKYDVDP